MRRGGRAAHLVDGEQLASLQVAQARRYIRALARFWCGGTPGRGKLDPVYVEVTQGRDPKANWAHWSSCGELSQAVAEHMGVKQPWLNRSPHWRAGRNLLDFYDVKHVPSAPARPPGLSYLPEPGDIGFIWLTGRDAHTFVFGDSLALDTHAGAQIETFNYGAGGMQDVEFPGARQSVSKLHTSGGQLFVGTRILHQVLTVPQLLACCGTLPEITNDTIAELEARIAA